MTSLAGSPTRTRRAAKEPLVQQCLELQQTLVQMAYKLKKIEADSDTAAATNKVMEQVLEDLIFKAGAVKQVGTSPATKLIKKSPTK